MQVLGVLLVIVGLLGCAWGVWASFLPADRASSLRRWGGAVIAPFAILAALTGVVLIVHPNFF